jgi:hypothetical protein
MRPLVGRPAMFRSASSLISRFVRRIVRTSRFRDPAVLYAVIRLPSSSRADPLFEIGRADRGLIDQDSVEVFCDLLGKV